MAELVDALASGASGSNTVQVQVLLRAPSQKMGKPILLLLVCQDKTINSYMSL